jgi:hypothetical protein
MTARPLTLTVAAPPPAPTYRYTPGNYASFQRATDSQTLMGQAIASAPPLKGFVKRWTWRSFENSATAGSTYPLMLTHELNSDLTWCQARGLKMVVMIEHVTFGYQDNTPNPDYLANYTGSYPTPANPSPFGYSIAIWDPYVRSRLKLLLTAFAARFGNHPALEGVMIEETSIGMSTADAITPPTGKLWQPYTQENYRDALIDILAHWATVQPDVRWWFYMNFMPYTTNNVRLGQYLNEVVLASPNCVITGPDAQSQGAPAVALEERTFWIYRDNNDVRPVAAFASTQVYATPATGAEIYDFSTGSLGAQYMCWVCQGVNNTNWKNKAKPQILGHPTFPNMLEDWT